MCESHADDRWEARRDAAEAQHLREHDDPEEYREDCAECRQRLADLAADSLAEERARNRAAMERATVETVKIIQQSNTLSGGYAAAMAAAKLHAETAHARAVAEENERSRDDF